MEIDTEQLKLEKDALDQSLALNKVVVSLLEERKKEMRHIWMVLLTICIIFAIAISVFAYFNYTDKQMLMEQLENTRVDFMEYLDTIEYTTTETTTETTITQDKVRQIPRVSTFNALLEECTISQEEKELMRLHYLENKDFCYIGDQLGYSEITMKRWHKKILRKLNKVL